MAAVSKVWRWAGPLVVVTLIISISGCGGIVRGHPDGKPVEISVALSKSWVQAVSQRVIVVGDGPGADHGRETTFGFGHGTYHSTTEVELVGGSRPGGADLVRYSLGWGITTFSMPIASGREIFWTVVISGGRSGIADLGSSTITNQSRIELDCQSLEALDAHRTEPE